MLSNKSLGYYLLLSSRIVINVRTLQMRVQTYLRPEENNVFSHTQRDTSSKTSYRTFRNRTTWFPYQIFHECDTSRCLMIPKEKELAVLVVFARRKNLKRVSSRTFWVIVLFSVYDGINHLHDVKQFKKRWTLFNLLRYVCVYLTIIGNLLEILH